MTILATSAETPLKALLPRQKLATNREAGTIGMFAAFKDVQSGEVHLSLRSDGSHASIHILEFLPAHWIVARNANGRVALLKETIVPGYFRDGHFYNCEEWSRKKPDS